MAAPSEGLQPIVLGPTVAPDCHVQIQGECYAKVCPAEITVGFTNDLEDTNFVSPFKVTKTSREIFKLLPQVKRAKEVPADDSDVCISFQLRSLKPQVTKTYTMSRSKGIEITKWSNQFLSIKAVVDDVFILMSEEDNVIYIQDRNTHNFART